jgi:hypothetical protein
MLYLNQDVKEACVMRGITLTLPRSAVSGRWRWFWWIGGILGGLFLLALIVLGLMMRSMALENTPPPDLDVSQTRLSEQGIYRGSYTSSLEPLKINKLHTWTLHLETANGQPVENATITVHGDMPGHGHGLPTRPLVSRHLGNGDYIVEGMKFQMPGWWFVEFDIAAGGHHDTLRFDFVLK